MCLFRLSWADLSGTELYKEEEMRSKSHFDWWMGREKTAISHTSFGHDIMMVVIIIIFVPVAAASFFVF